MTDGRRHEKLGWIGGWLGGFVWVWILAIVMIVQGRWIHGMAGLILGGTSAATVLLCSPWRHPGASYRALMLPVYALFLAAVAWGIWALGEPRRLGLDSWWALWLLLPVLLPLWTAGNRRWEDGEV